jgi:hypothetical protein
MELIDGNFMLVDVKPAEFAEHPKALAVFEWTAINRLRWGVAAGVR